MVLKSTEPTLTAPYQPHLAHQQTILIKDHIKPHSKSSDPMSQFQVLDCTAALHHDCVYVKSIGCLST